MANTTTSQYMLLPVPVPTVDPGPQWAVDVNTCLTTIDQHDHSTNKGTPVTPAGLNINMDMPINSHNLTALRSIRYTVQASPLSAGTDLGCTYVSGVDFYYNDVNGNQVRLTQNGTVAGTPGSISNLVAPASVSYVAGSQTFIFQSSTATAGNIDVGSVIIRQTTANAKGITLSSPNSLANNYTLTLPAALPSTALTAPIFLTSDASGNISDNTVLDNFSLSSSGSQILIKDQGIIQQKMAIRSSGANIGNMAISNSCGNFTTGSASFIGVTNLSVNLTTLGNPVMLMMNPIGSSGSAQSYINQNSGNSVEILYSRNNVIVTDFFLQIGTVSGCAQAPTFLDVVGAGSYNYVVNTKTSGGGLIIIQNYQFIAYEIK